MASKTPEDMPSCGVEEDHTMEVVGANCTCRLEEEEEEGEEGDTAWSNDTPRSQDQPDCRHTGNDWSSDKYVNLIDC